MVDGVQLAELGEEAAVRHVGPHAAPQLDPAAPVVRPVVQAPRLQVVRPRQEREQGRLGRSISMGGRCMGVRVC